MWGNRLVMVQKGNKFKILLAFGGHAVDQLVEALRFKLESRGFDFQLCHWNFSLT